MKHTDYKLRSLIKAISWRFLGTLDTIIIAWFITSQFTAALSIGIIETITKTFLFYGHERVWNKIHWGKSYAN